MEKIFFTSDAHLNHKNILKYTNRPKDWSMDQMTEIFVSSWNSEVSPGDRVYILGDLIWSDPTNNLLDMLNGNKYLIEGNHDAYSRRMEKKFVWIKDYHDLSISDPDAPGGKRHIILSHYPFETWRNIGHGYWHLHGHCHGTLARKPNYPRLDVSWDALNSYIFKDNYETALVQYEIVKDLLSQHKFLYHRATGENYDDTES